MTRPRYLAFVRALALLSSAASGCYQAHERPAPIPHPTPRDAAPIADARPHVDVGSWRDAAPSDAGPPCTGNCLCEDTCLLGGALPPPDLPAPGQVA